MQGRSRARWIATAGSCLVLAACNRPFRVESTRPSESAGYESRIGMAMKNGDGVCLSILNPALSPDTTVLLFNPSQPQSTAVALVAGPGPGCPGFFVPNQSNYALRIRNGALEDYREWIAVIGRLDPEMTFHACTSSEGVHLTLWKGRPIEGVRLWHGYRHVDYGVEPNCTEKETAQ